jgi:hypothetical protein
MEFMDMIFNVRDSAGNGQSIRDNLGVPGTLPILNRTCLQHAQWSPEELEVVPSLHLLKVRPMLAC